MNECIVSKLEPLWFGKYSGDIVSCHCWPPSNMILHHTRCQGLLCIWVMFQGNNISYYWGKEGRLLSFYFWSHSSPSSSSQQLFSFHFFFFTSSVHPVTTKPWKRTADYLPSFIMLISPTAEGVTYWFCLKFHKGKFSGISLGQEEKLCHSVVDVLLLFTRPHHRGIWGKLDV